MMTRGGIALVAFVVPIAAHAAVSTAHTAPVEIERFRVVEGKSGPDNYYAVVRDPALPFIHSRYRPPEATTVLGFEVPSELRSKVRVVRWKWRAITLPVGGNECDSHKADSAAVVYLTFKRLLHWSTLKYVWSAVGPRGATCDRKRSPFSSQDTIILESGPPLDAWKEEEIDLYAEYRNHFEGGKADADVPDFVGIGIMSDGDQTGSESSADYAGFVLGW
jgi:hypothetical protein